jgi:hypothetical protein
MLKRFQTQFETSQIAMVLVTVLNQFEPNRNPLLGINIKSLLVIPTIFKDKVLRLGLMTKRSSLLNINASLI